MDRQVEDTGITVRTREQTVCRRYRARKYVTFFPPKSNRIRAVKSKMKKKRMKAERISTSLDSIGGICSIQKTINVTHIRLHFYRYVLEK